jgi:hypothetical protein
MKQLRDARTTFEKGKKAEGQLQTELSQEIITERRQAHNKNARVTLFFCCSEERKSLLVKINLILVIPSGAKREIC